MSAESGLSIATCSWRYFTPDMGVPVRTTVGFPPRSFPYRVAQGSAFAPYGLLKVKDRGEFERRYLDRLRINIKKAERQLYDLVRAYPGQTLVMLCYEDVRYEWCHRTMLADWLAARYQIEVPELQPMNAEAVGPEQQQLL